MKTLRSIRWINDRLKDCRCDAGFLSDAKKARRPIERLIREAGLTVVRHAAYQFDHGGFTAVWLFKQSHLSLHSWPEHDFITLSLEVCSFRGDDASKIGRLHAGLLELFKPKESHPHKLTTNFAQK